MTDAHRIEIRFFDPTDQRDCTALGELFRQCPLAGSPRWYTPDILAAREQEAFDALVRRLTETATAKTPVDMAAEAVLVAETADGSRAGFVRTTIAVDYFTRQPVAHVENLATAPAYEGRGIGKALMRAAEAWARERGCVAVTLNVWPNNERARALYARLGFADDMVRMKKLLATEG